MQFWLFRTEANSGKVTMTVWEVEDYIPVAAYMVKMVKPGRSK